MAPSIHRPSALLHLRASRLPLAMSCPASSVEDGTPRIIGDETLSDLGTACHEVVTERIMGRDLEVADVAARYEVDADELDFIVGRTWAIWTKELRPRFADPQVEVPLEFVDAEAGLKLTGHPDITSTMALASAGRVHGCDLKTGFLDSDHTQQIKAYGFMLMQKHPEAESVYFAVARPREFRPGTVGTVDGWIWTRDELMGWYSDLLATLRRTNVFDPSPQTCSRCPRGLCCPARREMFRDARSLLLEVPNGTNAIGEPRLIDLPTDPEEKGPILAKIRERAKHLVEAAEFALRLVKVEVAESGGALPDGKGNELVLTEQRQRHILPSLAWRILVEEIGEERLIEEAVSISKGDVEKAAGKEAGHGMKGRVIKALLDRLDKAGALETKVIQKLELKKATNKIGVST